MKTLITGANGFIGTWLQRTICAQDDLTLIDNKWSPSVDALDFFRTNDEHYDRVFHCAAIVGGRATIDGGAGAVATNLALDAWLFRWAELTKPDQLVYFSSSAAYPVQLQQRRAPEMVCGGVDRMGRLREEAIDLTHVRPADNTYGLAKVTGEQLAARYRAEGGRVHVFRPFSGYAEDQSLDYPFPSFAQRAREHADPFHIWGNGEQVRDWIHVADIMGAVRAALMVDFREPVNLCTGVATSFVDLAATFMRVQGYSGAVEVQRDKPTGVQYRVGNPDLMKSFYLPKITVEEGVQIALRCGGR